MLWKFIVEKKTFIHFLLLLLCCLRKCKWTFSWYTFPHLQRKGIKVQSRVTIKPTKEPYRLKIQFANKCLVGTFPGTSDTLEISCCITSLKLEVKLTKKCCLWCSKLTLYSTGSSKSFAFLWGITQTLKWQLLILTSKEKQWFKKNRYVLPCRSLGSVRFLFGNTQPYPFETVYSITQNTFT